MRIVGLRLWFPELYGWYFTFKNGTPVGCLRADSFTAIKAVDGGTINECQLPRILRNGVLCDNVRIEVVEIDPARSNILSDDEAGHFIPIFYKYFDEVFREGSPFIDSDLEFLPILQRYFPVSGVCEAIDIGAGSGRYTKALLPYVTKLTACDIAVERLQWLRLEEKIDILECDIQHLPLEPRFDFAMCNFVLEHVANPYKVTDELIRVLLPRGKFVLSFPSFTYRDVHAAKQLNETPCLNFEHLRSFTGEKGVHPWEEETEKLTTHIKQRGCTILEIRGVNITLGLKPEEVDEILPHLDAPGLSSTNRPPWNLFGQQTIIFGQKNDSDSN